MQILHSIGDLECYSDTLMSISLTAVYADFDKHPATVAILLALCMSRVFIRLLLSVSLCADSAQRDRLVSMTLVNVSHARSGI